MLDCVAWIALDQTQIIYLNTGLLFRDWCQYIWVKSERVNSHEPFLLMIKVFAFP